MPSFARVENILAATPEWLFIPTPTMDTFAMCSSPKTLSAPILLATLRLISIAWRKSALGTVKVTSVRPSALVFWMIISTTMPTSPIGLKIWAAIPGRSGTLVMVMRASFLSQVTAATITLSIDTLFHFEGKDYLLIDTAGLRRKARIKSKLERYSIVRALKDINQSDVVILLISAQEGITHQDCQIISHAEKQGKCIILAINKWDLMPKGNQFKREYIKAVQNRLIFASFIPILTISALTGMGIDEIFPLVNKLYKAYTKRIPTAKINRFIEEITEEYQPPLSNNKRAKFYYTTQAQIKPPTFIIFTNYPDSIPDSYKRFLINRIRAGLGFHHVPIRLILRRKR